MIVIKSWKKQTNKQKITIDFNMDFTDKTTHQTWSNLAPSWLRLFLHNSTTLELGQFWTLQISLRRMQVHMQYSFMYVYTFQGYIRKLYIFVKTDKQIKILKC